MKTLSLSLLLCLLEVGATAAASSGLIITFQNIPHRIRRDNPDLAAARLHVQEALGRMQQAGRASNPELEGGLEQTGFREGKIEIGISQRFPVTNRLLLEKQISVVELRAAEAEIKNVERQLIAQARLLLVEILALRQQRGLRREQAKVAGELADFIGRMAKKGELSTLDAGQARLDAAQHRSSIQQLQAGEVATIGKLKPLLGLRITDTLNVSGTLPAAVVPGNPIDPKRRPDLQAAHLQTKAARQSVDLEKARRYDDIEAGLVAGLEHSEDAPEGFETEGIIGLRFKLALPFWDKNEGNIAAAKAKVERRNKEAKALAHNIRHEADAARREMNEWIELLNEIGTNLLALAQAQTEDTEKSYRDGLVDLQAVLRAREQELKLASSRIEALRNFHLARVRFDAAIAKP